jgi:hypothetical protein
MHSELYAQLLILCKQTGSSILRGLLSERMSYIASTPLWRWQGRTGPGPLSVDECNCHCTLVVRWRCWPMSSWRKRATACKSNGNAMSPLDRRGEKSSAAIIVMCSIGFMDNSNPALSLTPCMNFSRLDPTRPKSAKIEIEFYLVNSTGFSRCFPMVCRKAAAGVPSTTR